MKFFKTPFVFKLLSELGLAFNRYRVYFEIGIVVVFVLVILFTLTQYTLLFLKYKLNLLRAKKSKFVILQINFPHTELQGVSSTMLFLNQLHSLMKNNQNKFANGKLSLELVATKEGLRYLICLPFELKDLVTRNIRSIFPKADINTVEDYIAASSERLFKSSFWKSTTFKLKNNYSLPLINKNSENREIIKFLINHMNTLSANELISYQLILSPRLSKNKVPKLTFIAKSSTDSEIKHEKLSSKLFNATIRLTIIAKDKSSLSTRSLGLNSIISNLGTINQSLKTADNFIINHFQFNNLVLKFIFNNFKYRLQSSKNNTVLSSWELACLYSFPNSNTLDIEDMTKIRSPQLPPPLFLKQNHKFDVFIGQNTYGNKITKIGLTNEDRQRHIFVLGGTGTGKSTMMRYAAIQDIQKGRGVCIIDPHGDLAEELLANIPEPRLKDVIYFNPMDISYPAGLNILELDPKLKGDQLELEKELVTEFIISLFRKMFSNEDSFSAHRIEYILRNVIWTAFTQQNPTIFTIYELLNNPLFQKQVIEELENEDLKNFWKFEIRRAGNYQRVKMFAGITSKIGRLIFSPIARRILEQKSSTINFDDILDNSKILICNLAKGSIGEDNTNILGTLILTKIQIAALRRSKVESNLRKPFYLYVDEFQNFATTSFVQMLTEARKFKLYLFICEQSTSQQRDRTLINTIFANIGTVISFRSANPQDEALLLTQLSPYVKAGDIANLGRYKFYIKLSAVEPYEPFSGETIWVKNTNKGFLPKIIANSRKNYSIAYHQ